MSSSVMRKLCVRRWTFCAAAVAMLLGVVSLARAVVVLPGSGVILNGATVAARPELAAVNLEDNLTPFTIVDGLGNPVFSGNLQHRADRSVMRGTVIFEFRIRDTDPTLPGCIVGVSRTGFARALTDVDYFLDGLGTIGPDVAWRTGNGNEVDFGFLDNCIPGGSGSYFVFVLTDATTYNPSGGTITLYTDDGSSVTLTVAAP